MAAAVKVAQHLKEGQRCVVILADSVRNYMSDTVVFFLHLLDMVPTSIEIDFSLGQSFLMTNGCLKKVSLSQKPQWSPNPGQDQRAGSTSLNLTLVIMTFFLYLQVVGENCQLPPPVATFLHVTIGVLPGSH